MIITNATKPEVRPITAAAAIAVLDANEAWRLDRTADRWTLEVWRNGKKFQANYTGTKQTVMGALPELMARIDLLIEKAREQGVQV